MMPHLVFKEEGNLEEIMVERVSVDQEIVTHHPQDQDKEVNHHMEMIAQADQDQVQQVEEGNHHLGKEVVKVEGHQTIHHMEIMHKREEKEGVEEIDQVVLREDPILLGADMNLVMVLLQVLEEEEEEEGLILILHRQGCQHLLKIQINQKQDKGMVF